MMSGVEKSAIDPRNTSTAAAEISGSIERNVMPRKIASSEAPSVRARVFRVCVDPVDRAGDDQLGQSRETDDFKKRDALPAEGADAQAEQTAGDQTALAERA